MNLNLKLDLDYKTLLPILRKAQPYVFGLALVAVFAYTAYIVNAALNTAPAPPTAISDTSADSLPAITFDKTTIAKLKQLSGENGDVPTGNLGSSDPFR